MDEASVRRVIMAWTIEGPVPRYHRDWQRMLRREWPVLASALDRLALEWRAEHGQAAKPH